MLGAVGLVEMMTDCWRYSPWVAIHCMAQKGAAHQLAAADLAIENLCEV